MKCEHVLRARVPVLKFVGLGQIPCDVSIGSANGPQAAQWVREQSAHFRLLRPLCLVLKRLLKANRLNEPRFGGVGGCLLRRIQP